MSFIPSQTAKQEALMEFAALGQPDHLPLGMYLFPTEVFRESIHFLVYGLCKRWEPLWRARTKSRASFVQLVDVFASLSVLFRSQAGRE